MYRVGNRSVGKRLIIKPLENSMNLTDEHRVIVLDALEKWEEGLDSEMQGDELDEARKDIHTLRGALVGTQLGWLGNLGAITVNNLNTQDIKLLRPIVERYASDHARYILSTDYGVKLDALLTDFTYLHEIRKVQAKLSVNI